jgi:hypothetical protein
MQSDECLPPTENGFEPYVSQFVKMTSNAPMVFFCRYLGEMKMLWLIWLDHWQAPEIQTMYSIPFPVSTIRTRMRQEFERHRYVNKLPVVDVLLMQNNAEYQVCQVPYILMNYPRSPNPTKGRNSKTKVYLLIASFTGNYELLEANHPCHVILPRRPAGSAEVTRKLHARFLRGKHSRG